MTAGPDRVPLVAVGAGAGGAEALERLLGAVPEGTGAAWIVARGTDAASDEDLVSRLAGATAMPVAEAAEGTPIEPGRVYLAPPGAYLALRQERLALVSPPDPRSQARRGTPPHAAAPPSARTCRRTIPRNPSR